MEIADIIQAIFGVVGDFIWGLIGLGGWLIKRFNERRKKSQIDFSEQYPELAYCDGIPENKSNQIGDQKDIEINKFLEELSRQEQEI